MLTYYRNHNGNYWSYAFSNHQTIFCKESKLLHIGSLDKET